MLLLKGLVTCIPVTIVHPTWQVTRTNDEHKGWVFYDSDSGTGLKSTSGYGNFHVDRCTKDPCSISANSVRDLYEASNDATGKYTVPVLFDKKNNVIVNNESSEIIRMLSTEFNEWASGPYKDYNFGPPDLQKEIDEMNDFVYSTINNGVYKCGFAKSQEAYNEAVIALYSALDRVEEILSKNRYLLGDNLTECDIRLFPTLVRFDEVYIVYFKCNVKRISDYPNIINYCRDMYQIPGMSKSVDMTHIKTHYFTSHRDLNPYSVIPMGPDVIADLKKPHSRGQKATVSPVNVSSGYRLLVSTCDSIAFRSFVYIIETYFAKYAKASPFGMGSALGLYYLFDVFFWFKSRTISMSLLGVQFVHAKNSKPIGILLMICYQVIYFITLSGCFITCEKVIPMETVMAFLGLDWGANPTANSNSNSDRNIVPRTTMATVIVYSCIAMCLSSMVGRNIAEKLLCVDCIYKK